MACPPGSAQGCRDGHHQNHSRVTTMARDYQVFGRRALEYKTFPKKEVPPVQLEFDAMKSATVAGCARAPVTVADKARRASEEMKVFLAAAGLSKPQTSTTTPYATVVGWKKAAVMKVSTMQSIQMPTGGKRDRIKGMSSASRQRLRVKLAMVRNEERENALAVCLTYPRNAVKAEEWETYKTHLKVFNQAVKRHFDGSSGVWVLEFQKSGMPHFHLLVFGLKGRYDLGEIRTWMQQRWYDIAHAEDIHQGKAGTSIEWVKSGGGIMGYMAKYMSKGYTDNADGYTGRMWGRFGNLPLGEEEEMPLSREQNVKVQRWARKKMERDTNNARWKQFLEYRPESKIYDEGKLIHQLVADDGYKSRNPPAWAWGDRFFWEKVRSHHKRSIEHCRYEEGQMVIIDGEEMQTNCGYVWSWTSRRTMREQYKLPKRYKAKPNGSVTLVCNADSFLDAIKRGMERGLL